MKTRTLTAACAGAAAAAVMTTATAPAAAAATKRYTGTLERTRYSNVQVTIIVSGKRIKALSVSADPQDQRSYQLESFALPTLRKEALKAGSYKIHTVSGVTVTSDAFITSLYSAMGHAHLL